MSEGTQLRKQHREQPPETYASASCSCWELEQRPAWVELTPKWGNIWGWRPEMVTLGLGAVACLEIRIVGLWMRVQ
ncbi:hypothetical protein ACFXTH_001522 [Malus domestica]